MEGGSVYGGSDSDMTVILQNNRLPSSSNVLHSHWISNSSPSFQGDSASCSTSMVNFGDNRGGKGNQMNTQFFPPIEKDENGNGDYGHGFHQLEKKRRLRADQVMFLERNFESENKIEPERKVKLAEELGLQPRQVAIWFQNRRARFKTKQLEKDYDGLKVSYDRLKADHDNLLKERERLREEVCLLTDKLLLREKESTNSNSSIALGQERSDFSPNDEDDLTRNLLPSPCFPKLENGCYDDPPGNGCNSSFSVEGQPSWLWHY
ncbi:hypothetical protein U1Q18_016933 [Sarracenia purpurea var. burkii]